MSSNIGVEKDYHSRWVERVARWRTLPKFGKWWWWMWLNMQLSDWPYVGRFFTWLAGLPLGPYRKKWPLARITSKPYVSPYAQVACADLRLSPGCWIDDLVVIYSTASGGSVILNKGVHIHRGTILEVGQGGQVVIGEATHIQANCNLNGHGANVRIGRDVMIAPHCGFYPYQHRMDNLNQPMSEQEPISKGDIVIEDDVWLGAGVQVMDGVHIGRGAVIGANAVVTQNIPPCSIAAGIPARVIGKRDSEKTQDAN